MKARNKSLVLGVIAPLAIALTAKAADQPHPCSQLFDDAQRLGCYDGAFGRPRPPEGRPAATSTAPATAVVPAATVAAPVAVAPQSASVAAPAAAPAPERLPDKFQSPVKSLSSTADGRFIATLENGQVWVQSERDSRTDVRVGDVVTMRRMLMGNYTMDTRTGPLRVKRVE